MPRGDRRTLAAARDASRRGAPAAPDASSRSSCRRRRCRSSTIKLLFAVGSAHDPKGKEGLAALAAAMIADAGSKALRIDEIKQGALPDGRRASTRRSTRR